MPVPSRFITRRSAGMAAICASGALFAIFGAGVSPRALSPGTSSVASSEKPSVTTLAGISYDPAAPLNATETPLFNPEKPPSQARSYRVSYAGGNGKTVPGMLTLPGSAKPEAKVPVLLLLHGLGGRKEDLLPLGVALAQRGYATLAIDIAGHGKRELVGGKPVAEQPLEGMREIAAQTVMDLRRGVDYLEARPEIDTKRIGYLGVSLGGILGGVFAGNEPRLKAVCLWASGGDWGKLITTSGHSFAKYYRERGDTDPVKIEKVMSEVDPLRYVGNIAPRPLLFLNGTQDDIVPKPCTEELFAAAKDPKRIEFIPGGHVPELKPLIDTTMTWLDENLKATKTAAAQ